MTTLLEKFATGVHMEQFCWPYVIAGGALRDSWFDKEVTDVDVFIGVPKSLMEDVRRRNHCYLYNTALDLPFGLGCSAGSFNDERFDVDGSDKYDLDKFLSLRSSVHPGLNIILRELPDANTIEEETETLVSTLLEEFPCSISKLAYDPRNNKWWVDKEFEGSLASRTVVFSSDVKQKYVDKIFPKYSGEFGSVKKSPITMHFKYGHSILRHSSLAVGGSY